MRRLFLLIVVPLICPALLALEETNPTSVAAAKERRETIVKKALRDCASTVADADRQLTTDLAAMQKRAMASGDLEAANAASIAKSDVDRRIKAEDGGAEIVAECDMGGGNGDGRRKRGRS